MRQVNTGIFCSVFRCAGILTGSVEQSSRDLAGACVQSVKDGGRLFLRPFQFARKKPEKKTEDADLQPTPAPTALSPLVQEATRIKQEIASTVEVLSKKLGEIMKREQKLQEQTLVLEEKISRVQERMAPAAPAPVLPALPREAAAEVVLAPPPAPPSLSEVAAPEPVPGPAPAPALVKTHVIAEALVPPASEEPVRTKEQKTPPGSKTPRSLPTPERIGEARFSSAMEKVVFRRALEDLMSPDESARISAAKALGSIRHELSQEALVAGFQLGQSEEVQGACLSALTQLEMPGSQEVMVQALENKSPVVRMAAVRGIYRLLGAGGAAHLISTLSDGDEDVRRRAVTCLGWLEDEGYAKYIVPLLDDPCLSVRRAVVEALGSLKTRLAVDKLIEMLQDEDRGIRKLTNAALEQILGRKLEFRGQESKEDLLRLMARWRKWWKESETGGN
ncbi:MAG: HEAT repeat domain-containing protein [Planctomycetes bacterium]|nr:HEAT repeat domain-containing protein [Planctomycetota bacterium]